MPLAEYLEGEKSAQPPATKPDSAAKLRKQVFLQGGAMIALGLLLAGWYVGYRVFAARSAQPPVPVSVAVTKEAPKNAVVAPQSTPLPKSKPIELPTPVAPPALIVKPDLPATSHQQPTTISQPPPTVKQATATSKQQPATVIQKPNPRFARHEASPRAGERYLQIAAFGPKALDGFLKTLEGQGLHPLVAPGPVDNIYRILVGPFPNPTALEEARALIRASGVEPILRTY